MVAIRGRSYWIFPVKFLKPFVDHFITTTIATYGVVADSRLIMELNGPCASVSLSRDTCKPK
jgi:hypothetical protein